MPNCPHHRKVGKDAKENREGKLVLSGQNIERHGSVPPLALGGSHHGGRVRRGEGVAVTRTRHLHRGGERCHLCWSGRNRPQSRDEEKRRLRTKAVIAQRAAVPHICFQTEPRICSSCFQTPALAEKTWSLVIKIATIWKSGMGIFQNDLGGASRVKSVVA